MWSVERELYLNKCVCVFCGSRYKEFIYGHGYDDVSSGALGGCFEKVEMICPVCGAVVVFYKHSFGNVIHLDVEPKFDI